MESSAPQAHRRPVNAVAGALVALAMILAAFSLWTAVPLTWIRPSDHDPILPVMPNLPPG